MSDDKDLSGRVAVVFGATKGIGRAIALELAGAGATVVVHGRDEAAGSELLDQIAEVGPPGQFATGDIHDPAAVRRVIDDAVKVNGSLHVVVANGGSGQPKARLLHDVDVTDIPKYFESRTFHRLYAIHAAYAHMRTAGYGKIISVTTEAGRSPTPSEGLVGAAAASVVFATRAFGREFARNGVRINTICTTLTSGTPPYERYEGERDSGSEQVIVKAFRKIEETAPFGINEPTDIAKLAKFLASPESDRISGATISVTAGLAFP